MKIILRHGPSRTCVGLRKKRGSQQRGHYYLVGDSNCLLLAFFEVRMIQRIALCIVSS